MLDGRLFTLWRHCGESWPSLETRLKRAPAASVKLAALRSLRARLASGTVELPAVHIEDALAWLSAPAPRRAPRRRALVATALHALDDATLVARLRDTSPAMPRAEMEELLRRGANATALLAALLRRGARGDATLWAVVVLGELRDAGAVAPLAALLGARAEDLATAAAEALAKIGAPAVPTLVAASERGSHDQRLRAYGALGSIRTPESFEHLLDGLTAAPELADVIARALALHGRREALPFLAAAARRAPGWMRPYLAAAAAALASRPVLQPIDCDWRLRYRRLPALGWRFPPDWTTIAAGVHRRRRTGSATGRAAADIRVHVRLDPSTRRCSACGGQVWQPTGLPLCRHTGHAVVSLQRSMVERWAHAGGTDAWRALDECDAADVRLARASHGARPQWIEQARQVVAVGRATLYWLVAVGCEYRLGHAFRHLDAVTGDLDALYGANEPSWRTPPATRDCPQNYS